MGSEVLDIGSRPVKEEKSVKMTSGVGDGNSPQHVQIDAVWVICTHSSLKLEFQI